MFLHPPLGQGSLELKQIDGLDLGTSMSLSVHRHPPQLERRTAVYQPTGETRLMECEA
jgi:hypothetical protein